MVSEVTSRSTPVRAAQAMLDLLSPAAGKCSAQQQASAQVWVMGNLNPVMLSSVMSVKLGCLTRVCC